MLERMWSKGNTPLLLVGESKLVQSLWKSVWQFHRKLGVNLPQNPAVSLLDIPKGCSIITQGHLLNYVQSSIICNGQNLETT